MPEKPQPSQFELLKQSLQRNDVISETDQVKLKSEIQKLILIYNKLKEVNVDSEHKLVEDILLSEAEKAIAIYENLNQKEIFRRQVLIPKTHPLALWLSGYVFEVTKRQLLNNQLVFNHFLAEISDLNTRIEELLK